MDRPALQQLLADIESRKIDCVVLYKIDRLSRSLLDFAKLMETFDQHHVSFVAVTQQVNSATSMGRLMLNVLLSFAQFEREIIAERTRDKIAAARRKGKWSGGMPLLGYDVDPKGSKLIVNEAEAVRVRAIFELYREHQALLAVVGELERRGWRTKCWTTRKGRTRGGVPFTRTNLYHLLTRVAYVGKIKYKSEVHPGEHRGIVDLAVWEQVQALLGRYGRRGSQRFGSGALLGGLLQCVSCDCRMSPTYAMRPGGKRYRYYVCGNAQRRGWHRCPSKSVSAASIERVVLSQVQALAANPERLQAMIAGLPIPDGRAEDRSDTDDAASVSLDSLRRATADDLPPDQKAAVVRGLVERINYDGANGKIAITFRSAGLQALANGEDQP
jgi:site-specific DNA recombinase